MMNKKNIDSDLNKEENNFLHEIILPQFKATFPDIKNAATA